MIYIYLLPQTSQWIFLAGIGLIIVWSMFILVTLLYSTPVGQACMTDIAASQILTKLYDGNVLMKFITKF